MIEVAVAGLGDKDIEVETKDNVLSIKHDNQKNDKSNVVHRGIAARSFLLQFTLSPEILVKGADLNNGLLSINMERIVPESEKPKKIEINSGKVINGETA